MLTLLVLTVGLMPLALLGVPIFVLTVYVVRGLARLARGWYWLSLGIAIEPPQPPPPARSLLRRVRQMFASGSTWREIGYQLLLPVSAVTTTLTLTLEHSRRRVIDSVQTERRRIERDLHDGAQQRLVALAMKLGRARARYRSNPTEIGDLLAEAHDEDSVLLREGLCRLLIEAGLEVQRAVDDSEQLLRAVEERRPEAVAADVRMPPTHTDEGLWAALVIRQRWSAAGGLVLSPYVEERYATDLLAGDTRGGGYLLKDRVADVDEFIEALRRVGGGGTALDPEVVSQLLTRSRRRDPLAVLTPREREVLQLMTEGRSNAGIAGQLVVTEGTVESTSATSSAKLDLPPTDTDHRRVLAVLRFLEG